MKALIDIKFNDIRLSLDNHNNSDFIHGFIFEELHAERELLSVTEFAKINDNQSVQDSDTTISQLMLQIIMDLPESLYENYDTQTIFNYIHNNLDIKHISFLNHWFSDSSQYVLIEMDENNPSLNFDYTELDL